MNSLSKKAFLKSFLMILGRLFAFCGIDSCLS
jgi:hypothetical protein